MSSRTLVHVNVTRGVFHSHTVLLCCDVYSCCFVFTSLAPVLTQMGSVEARVLRPFVSAFGWLPVTWRLDRRGTVMETFGLGLQKRHPLGVYPLGNALLDEGPLPRFWRIGRHLHGGASEVPPRQPLSPMLSLQEQWQGRRALTELAFTLPRSGLGECQ